MKCTASMPAQRSVPMPAVPLLPLQHVLNFAAALNGGVPGVKRQLDCAGVVTTVYRCAGGSHAHVHVLPARLWRAERWHGRFEGRALPSALALTALLPPSFGTGMAINSASPPTSAQL